MGGKHPRYQNLPSVQEKQSVVASKIKPQIAKEYTSTMQMGRPDLRILQEEFEFRDKFYEP